MGGFFCLSNNHHALRIPGPHGDLSQVFEWPPSLNPLLRAFQSADTSKTPGPFLASPKLLPYHHTMSKRLLMVWRCPHNMLGKIGAFSDQSSSLVLLYRQIETVGSRSPGGLGRRECDLTWFSGLASKRFINENGLYRCSTCASGNFVAIDNTHIDMTEYPVFTIDNREGTTA